MIEWVGSVVANASFAENPLAFQAGILSAQAVLAQDYPRHGWEAYADLAYALAYAKESGILCPEYLSRAENYLVGDVPSLMKIRIAQLKHPNSGTQEETLVQEAVQFLNEKRLGTFGILYEELRHEPSLRAKIGQALGEQNWRVGVSECSGLTYGANGDWSLVVFDDGSQNPLVSYGCASRKTVDEMHGHFKGTVVPRGGNDFSIRLNELMDKMVAARGSVTFVPASDWSVVYRPNSAPVQGVVGLIFAR